MRLTIAKAEQALSELERRLLPPPTITFTRNHDEIAAIEAAPKKRRQRHIVVTWLSAGDPVPPPPPPTGEQLRELADAMLTAPDSATQPIEPPTRRDSFGREIWYPRQPGEIV
jgi:hypothetical protein